ncbi:MAG: hypothetical protein ACON5K_03030 [Bacteroidia bacterium]
MKNEEYNDLRNFRVVPEISPNEMWNKFQSVKNKKSSVSKWLVSSVAAVWFVVMWISIDSLQNKSQENASSFYEDLKLTDNTIYND